MTDPSPRLTAETPLVHTFVTQPRLSRMLKPSAIRKSGLEDRDGRQSSAKAAKVGSTRKRTFDGANADADMHQRRRQWAPPVNIVYENGDHFPAHAEGIIIPAFNRQHSEPTTHHLGDSQQIGMWSHTSAPGLRRPGMQRPVTIHEGAFQFDFANELAQANATSWNHLTIPGSNQYSYASNETFQAIDVADFGNVESDRNSFHEVSTASDNNGGISCSKPADEHLDFSNLDSALTSLGHDINSSDENAPIINLGKVSALEEPLSLDTSFSRRYSGSSFVSSTGGANDIPDISTYSEVPSYASDYTPRSSLNLSATPLSPVASPRYPIHAHDAIRTGSRSRASPSPRPTVRAAPYSIESARNKRWSTGSYGPSPSRRNSPFAFGAKDGTYASALSALSRIDSPVEPAANPFLASSNLNNISLHTSAFQAPPRFHRPTPILPSNLDALGNTSNPLGLTSTPVLPSNHSSLVRTLASNVDPYLHHHLDQYACLSDPPDLFGSLSEETLAPPPEDLNPSDLELVPHEQELRFDNDLYTPRWVRGHGNKREGWCGICKPGRWLVLKNSAFWYDKSFTHGVSAATGQAFEGPKETRRMEGNADVWEGLCGSCGEWIALVSSKKKGTTWFRHAYKCHTHPKIKDVPKRRRGSNQGRPDTSSSTPTKPKTDPVTPESTPPGPGVETFGPGVKTISTLESISSMI